jgi:aspartate aminotransferase-like enzyme
MTLFTAGPITMDPETISIGGTQAQYFRTPEFSQIMLDCTEMLKKVLDAPSDARMIFLTASGTAAMEASVINLFTQKDKILILSGGTFGRRFEKICEIYQIPFESINLKWNEAFTEEMLAPFENASITGMLVNVCETSTGQLYPMNAISEFCRRNHICLVVDTISSFLCDPFSMKTLGADAVIISSQKGLALQPGMAFVVVTKEAFENRCIPNNPKTLYFNFADYYHDILRGQTPFTPEVGIINQLHDKLNRILKYGVQEYIDHCYHLANYFRNMLAVLPSLNTVDYPLSNCVTPVVCGKKNAKNIVDRLRNEYDIFVVPSPGDLEQIMFRVAHMSKQITTQNIDELVTILKNFEDQS